MEKRLQAKLEKIVKERFPEITTLETRNRENQDFHEVTVWGLKEVLIQAYELGVRDGQTK